MSRPGDHHYEMPGAAPFDDASVEAFLSGRPVDAGQLGPVAAFADDVRVAIDGPPPAPTVEMARLLTEGIQTPTGASRAALAPARGTRDAHLSKRRKPMLISELLAGLLARLAGLGAASKAALGLGVAAASVTGAGAAGILPDPAQQAVAKVVSAATPFEFEDPDAAVAQVEDSEDTGDAEGTGAIDGEGDDVEAGALTANHGACVSEVARNAPRGPGGEHGRAVSAVARSDCGKSPAGTDPSATTTSVPGTTTTTVDDGEASVDANPRRSGPGADAGNPNRGSSGPGRSGNGGSGPGSSGPGGGQGPGRSGK